MAYLFSDSWSGSTAIFSTETKAKEFRKAWRHCIAENDWDMEEGEDWSISEIPDIDTPVEDWFKKFEGRD